MYLFVLLAGIVAAVIGVAVVGYGLTIYEFGLGNTMIIAGTTLFAGGLVLIALAAVLCEVRTIGNALAGRTDRLTQAAEAQFARLGEPPLAVRPADLASRNESLAERIQPSLTTDTVIKEREDAPLSPRPPLWPFQRPGARSQRTSGAGAEPDAPRESGALGTEPLSGTESVATEPRSSGRIFDQRRTQARRSPGQPPGLSQDDANASARPEQPAPTPSSPAEPSPVSILKSGVIDGMAYTLYTDGSIEAELPAGTMHFASIEKLREYLEGEGG